MEKVPAPAKKDKKSRRAYDVDKYATMSEDEPLYSFDSEDLSSFSSSSSSSSSYSSTLSEPLPAKDDAYFDDQGTGFHILKPGMKELDEHYQETDLPSPVHTF